jgi:pre-mRNA-splicing factor CWC22
VDPQEIQLDQRVQWMIQVLFQIRKDKFKDHPGMKEELDLVDDEDRITHTISLLADDLGNMDDGLTVFKFDPDFVANEKIYAEIKDEIIGDVDLEALTEQSDEKEEESMPIDSGSLLQDRTGADLVQLRKNIYLIIMSSLDFEECCHKLLKMKISETLELEICNMIAECCSQERIYNKFFGFLADRLCQVNPKWATYFEQCFSDIYQSIHRFETNRIRNLSKLFAFLMANFSVSWPNILRTIRLTESDTTSASRVFIKFLFTEMAKEMGLQKLNQYLNPSEEPTLEWQEALAGIFPTDNTTNMRFSINFFTAIELGPLTDRLREIYAQVTAQQSAVKHITHKESGYESDHLNLSDVSLSDDEFNQPRKKTANLVRN